MSNPYATPPMGRLTDAQYGRQRDHLTEEEIDRLQRAAAKTGRLGHWRNAFMIGFAYKHGLRVGELVAYKVDQIDWTQRTLYCWRLKRGSPSTHPLGRTELASLRRLVENRTRGTIFATEHGTPLGARAVQTIIRRAGEEAGFGFVVHPHMLRHACGYHLANEGRDTRAIQAWLGHRNIQHTVHYTELAPDRFKDFWKD